MGIARTFSINAMYQFGIAFSSKLASLVLLIVLPILLPVEQLGIYSWVISIALIADIFADFGTGDALVTFISGSRAAGKFREAAGYFRYLYRLRMQFLVLMMGVVLVTAPVLAPYFFRNPLLLFPMQTAALFLFFRSTDSFLKNTFVALKEMKYVLYAYLAQSIFRLVFIIGFILWISPTFLSAIIGYSLALLLSAGILLFLLVRHFPDLWFSPAPISEKKTRSFVQYAAFASFGFILFLNVDIQMITLMLPIENVAYYSVGMGWAAAIIGALPIFLVLPVLSELRARGASHLQAGFSQFFKYAAAFLIPASFFMAYLSTPLIHFFYGPPYAEQVPSILFILSFMILFSGLSSLLSMLYLAIGKPRAITYCMLLTLFLAIGLNSFLIPLYGVSGAAVATVLSYVSLFVFSSFLLQSIADIPFPSLFFIKPFVAAATMFSLLSFVPTPSLPLALFFTFLAGIGYLLLQLLIRGLTLSEIIRLWQRIRAA